jgi:hypothetical protein
MRVARGGGRIATRYMKDVEIENRGRVRQSWRSKTRHVRQGSRWLPRCSGRHHTSGTCAVLRAGRYNTYQITSSHARDNVPASFFTASLQSAHILVCPPRPVVCPPQSFAVTTYRLHDMTEHEHHPCRTPMHIHPTC